MFLRSNIVHLFRFLYNWCTIFVLSFDHNPIDDLGEAQLN